MAIRWAGLTLAVYLTLATAVPALGATSGVGRLSPTPPVALGPVAPGHASSTPSHPHAPADRAPADRGARPLPNTGIDVGELALGGLALMLLGAGLELVTPPRRVSRPG